MIACTSHPSAAYTMRAIAPDNINAKLFRARILREIYTELADRGNMPGWKGGSIRFQTFDPALNMDKVINELKFNSVSGNYETLFRKCRSLSSREIWKKKGRDKEKERTSERKSRINNFHYFAIFWTAINSLCHRFFIIPDKFITLLAVCVRDITNIPISEFAWILQALSTFINQTNFYDILKDFFYERKKRIMKY